MRLPPRPSAPRLARRIVRDACSCSELPGRLVDDAVVVASELVTHRIRQTRQPVDVVVEVSTQGVTVRVQDQQPATVMAFDPSANSGQRRTRDLVQRLASSWGYSTSERGCEAWASLRLPLEHDRYVVA